MTIPSDQPGWRPDPARPGMVRWWNGLGWSDARRQTDQTIERVRDAAQNALRGSTITPQQVASLNADRRTLRGAPEAAGRATAKNPLGAPAVVLALIGLGIGLFGVPSLIALLLSIGALVRSRRLAGQGFSRTGLGPALAGLVLSVIGLLLLVPLAVQALPGLLDR